MYCNHFWRFERQTRQFPDSIKGFHQNVWNLAAIVFLRRRSTTLTSSLFKTHISPTCTLTTSSRAAVNWQRAEHVKLLKF